MKKTNKPIVKKKGSYIPIISILTIMALGIGGGIYKTINPTQYTPPAQKEDVKGVVTENDKINQKELSNTAAEVMSEKFNEDKVVSKCYVASTTNNKNAVLFSVVDNDVNDYFCISEIAFTHEYEKGYTNLVDSFNNDSFTVSKTKSYMLGESNMSEIIINNNRQDNGSKLNQLLDAGYKYSTINTFFDSRLNIDNLDYRFLTVGTILKLKKGEDIKCVMVIYKAMIDRSASPYSTSQYDFSIETFVELPEEFNRSIEIYEQIEKDYLYGMG